MAAGGLASGAVNGALAGSTAQPSAISSAQAQGILINASSNVDPVPVIYGTRKVGGARCLVQASGSSNEYLHLVISLGEGEIDSVTNVYLDDVLISDAKYSGLYTLEIHTGADAQAASTALIAALPGIWTAAHTGSGIAYLYIRLKYDANAFHGLPTITADVRGKKLYDPRTGLTAWSNNPALCIRDYLTNPRYGRGVSSALIDDASFIAAANHCDEQVSIPGGTQARYTCDGLVDVNDTVFNNLVKLLTCCRGMMIYSGGKYRLVPDRLTAPGFAFTEDNITGDWQITQPGRRDKYNRVTASIFNSAANWQPDFAISDSAAFRAQDNGLLLESKIDLPFTSDLYRGQQLAGLHLKTSRFGIVATFSAFQEALRCEVGDVVSITHSTPGWVAKPFRVVQITLKSDDEVDVVVREYSDTAYNLDTLTAITGAPGTNLPNPLNVAAPSALTLASGTAELLVAGDGAIISRIRAAWAAAPDVFVSGYELNWRKSADAAWQSILTKNPAVWLSPVEDGVAYDARVRAENPLGVRSAWVTAPAHTVIGKTELPSTVTNVATSQEFCFFRKVDDADVPGYEIRAVPGTNPQWSMGVAIHTGLVTDAPYRYAKRLTGIQTIMVAAVDSGGRYGLPGYATLDFGVIDSYNIAQSCDYKADGFPGTIVNGSVTAGNLVANADPVVDFWGLGGDDFWTRDNAADLWGGTAYLPLQYSSATFAPKYSGGDLILDTTLSGSRSTVEWRIDGAVTGDFWAQGGADFWGGADFYGAMPAWQSFIGAIASTANQGIQFRVSFDGGPQQGDILAMSSRLQMPAQQQVFSNLAISAAGTRLPPASGSPAVGWIRVEEVNFTIYVDGSGATSGRVIDFDPVLGPLVQALNAAGTAVNTTGQSARVSGY